MPVFVPCTVVGVRADSAHRGPFPRPIVAIGRSFFCIIRCYYWVTKVWNRLLRLS